MDSNLKRNLKSHHIVGDLNYGKVADCIKQEIKQNKYQQGIRRFENNN